MSNRKRQKQRQRTERTPQRVDSDRRFRHKAGLSQRARGEKNEKLAFAPPEDWYEPSESEEDTSYRIVVQEPGEGFRHVVTPGQIRRRLAQLPAEMLYPLDVVQLSRMTRKKRSFPCYGMQWGTTLYLYPIEESLIECYSSPPKPSQLVEARMYGGRWVNTGVQDWELIWTERAIRDYYLNNILIHELGHLLDNRNRSYVDRERYAEWFAIEHGYRQQSREESRGRNKNRAKRVVRRHHGS